MNKNKRLSIILILLIMFTLVTPIYANSTSLTQEQLKWLEDNLEVTTKGKILVDSSTVKKLVFLKPPENTATYQTTINGDTLYWAVKTDDQLSKAIASKINDKHAVDKMQNLTSDLEMTADTQQAAVMLAGIAPLVNIILGVIATLIMFGMAIFTSFDIVYLAFPVFRNKTEEWKQQGNYATTKKNANGDVSLRWITDDAQFAIASTISQGTGESPWWIYFRKRVWAYIMLTIVMFILLTGNITLITDIALKVVSGILNVLSDLA